MSQQRGALSLGTRGRQLEGQTHGTLCRGERVNTVCAGTRGFRGGTPTASQRPHLLSSCGVPGGQRPSVKAATQGPPRQAPAFLHFPEQRGALCRGRPGGQSQGLAPRPSSSHSPHVRLPLRSTGEKRGPGSCWGPGGATPGWRGAGCSGRWISSPRGWGDRAGRPQTCRGRPCGTQGHRADGERGTGEDAGLRAGVRLDFTA